MRVFIKFSLIFLITVIPNVLLAQVVSGVIVDKSNQTPLAAAYVNVIGSAISTYSLEDGSFSLNVSSGYPCLIEITKNGFQGTVLNLKEPERSIRVELRPIDVNLSISSVDDETIFPVDYVDEYPVMPGCGLKKEPQEKRDCFKVALSKYVQGELEWPKKNTADVLETTVWVRIEIGKDGILKEVVISKGVYEAFNNAAIAAVWKLPKMNPALLNGKPVSMNWTFPVVFSALD